MMSLNRRTRTLHTLKNEYYLEVEGLKYRIFEFDHGKVQADDQYGSAQLFRYQTNLDGFDGSVYAGTLQMETKLV
jgi:hypothetical protein